MKYLKNVKQTLKAATERNWLLKNPLAGYKCSYFNPERDILDEIEIMQLYNKKLPIARLAEVRTLICSCVLPAMPTKMPPCYSQTMLPSSLMVKIGSLRTARKRGAGKMYLYYQLPKK